MRCSSCCATWVPISISRRATSWTGCCLGISPDRISYGNTIKKAADIRYFHEKGVSLFATDSEADLRNIAKEAPGARVFCRILTEGSETADWPLSRKFGCHPDMAIDLVLLAREIGLKPCGISFHVGSQQRDIGTWDSAIAKVRYIFDYLEGEGLKLNLINMGGGFPANYISKTNEMTVYSEEITRYLEEDFGEDAPGNHSRARPFARRRIRHPGKRGRADQPEVLDGRRQMALSRHR
ncbi:MAG: hypothetical protein V8T86_06495 [Victivallis sp.]